MRLAVGLWGSGEFEPWAEEPERWLLDRVRTGDGSVLVIPTAAAPEGGEVFDRWGRIGLAHYEGMGVAARVLPLKVRRDADRTELLAELERVSMVFFSGGNPAYLARVLAGSAFWLRLLERMEQGLAYAGCSAGIAALGEVTGDSALRDLTRGDIWQPGLGLFPNLSFGAHWNALDRFVPGLRDLIVERIPDGSRFLAIDEDTAVVGDGTEWQVMGAGGVHLYEDGRWYHHGAASTFRLSAMGASER